MKLITCEFNQIQMVGVLQGDEVCLPPPDIARRFTIYSDMLELINQAPTALKKIIDVADKKVHINEVRILPPIPAPKQNIICLGWNYADHINETTDNKELSQTKLPKHPIVFTKDTSSVNGPYDTIPYDPQISSKIDWEVELAFVIGKYAHKVQESDALEYVFGYTIINDISARDLQKRHRQFFLGKSLPGSCPMGPCIVTADEIEDPQNLRIESRVNGVVKQKSSTRHQIFGVANLIERFSHIMPLHPGTIVATGTPSGVGYVREPPEYLSDGDVVECEVEKVGCISNTVVRI